MNAASLLHTLPTPAALVGQVRRFGPFGPAYVVESLIGEREGEFWFEVLVPETGERTDRTAGHQARPAPNHASDAATDR